MRSTNTWAPGAQVGQYLLLSSLVTGDLADVWLARQLGVRGIGGVEKLIRRARGAALDHEFIARARLAAALSHRAIAQLYELGEDDGWFFMVMELIEGESLARCIEASRAAKQPVPMAIAAQLVAWAAEGLHYAHTRAVMHRDVRPENLMVTTEGFIKLLNFGITTARDEPSSSQAPESRDARADVFALGVVLYELLTGTRSGELGERHLPRCSERAPHVPPALDALVARVTAPRPAERLASARELQAALEDWLTSSGQRASSSDVTAWLSQLFPSRAAERSAVLRAVRAGESVAIDAALFTDV